MINKPRKKYKKEKGLPFITIEDVLLELDNMANNLEYGSVHVFLYLKSNKYIILSAYYPHKAPYHYDVYDMFGIESLNVLKSYEQIVDYGTDYYVPKEVLISVLSSLSIKRYEFNRKIKWKEY